MIELTHPWALALLALPLLMRLLPAYKESRDSIKVPFFDKLVELSEQRPETGAMDPASRSRPAVSGSFHVALPGTGCRQAPVDRPAD